MSTQEQIGKLQGLLARIQRNATLPRGGAPLPPPVAFAPPPAMPAAPPAPPAPVYVAPPPAPAAHDVDDLLDAAPAASPLPVEVDVQLDSIPPVAEKAPSEAPEAEPIPLVNAAAPPPASEPDDAFSLESEVSEVRVTTATREAVEVTVAAIEAEAEPIATEELSEDDLVEVTEGTPPPATTDVDIDFDDQEEQPPASSKRQVASSMDEALAAAAEQLDAEHEVPIKTPPPESGPQEAPLAAGMGAPAAPDVDALLGGELDIPTREPAIAAPGPTPEQLGQTIDLDEARGPSLELAEHQAEAAPAAAHVEELEVALPGREAGGGYDDNLQPPPEALSELEAHRRSMEDDIPPPPESLATLPSVQPGPAPVEVVPVQAAPAAPLAPEVVARPAALGTPETFASVRETFRPSSFVELLDASLALNGD
ncbi:MAG TPA: hypothetical protein VHB79_30625 [Polyangiaceae bacterium]|nr:hypothetical protein [Polyangiaceae bacterium]